MYVCTGDVKFAMRVGALFPDVSSSVIDSLTLTSEIEILQGHRLVVIDLEPGFKGMEGIHENMPKITAPCLALSNVPNFEEAEKLIRLGIRGYGNKYMRPDNFRQAVKTVMDGQLWMIPSILNRLIQTLAGPEKTAKKHPAFWSRISKREQEVAELIAKGLSNQEIADAMFVSLRTVKAHLTSIYGKTGCRDRMDLALKINQST